MSDGKERNSSKFATITAVTSMVVSLCSLAVAARGCHRSEEAHRLSLQTFAEERQVVYAATIENDEFTVREINLRPIAAGMHLQGGQIIFPQPVYSSPLPINQDGAVHHLGSFAFDLRKYITARFPKADGDHINLAVTQIPAIFHTSYIAKNQEHEDVSIYLVELQATYTKKNEDFPRIACDGLTFVARLDSMPKDQVAFITEFQNTYFPIEQIEPE